MRLRAQHSRRLLHDLFRQGPYFFLAMVALFLSIASYITYIFTTRRGHINIYSHYAYKA